MAHVFQTWTLLLRVLPHRAAFALFLFPFVGHLILFSEGLHALFEPSLHAEVANQCAPLRVTTRNALYLLYYGFFLIAASALICRITCPIELQEYRSAKNFISSYPYLQSADQVVAHSKAWRRTKNSRLNDLILGMEKCVQELELIRSRTRGQDATRMDVNATSERVLTYKTYFFEFLNFSPLWAPICYALLYCGLGLAFVPTISAFAAITCSFLL